MKGFNDFIEFAKSTTDISNAYAEFQDEISSSANDASKLAKTIIGVSTIISLSYLQSYHEWLHSDKH